MLKTIRMKTISQLEWRKQQVDSSLEGGKFIAVLAPAASRRKNRKSKRSRTRDIGSGALQPLRSKAECTRALSQGVDAGHSRSRGQEWSVTHHDACDTLQGLSEYVHRTRTRPGAANHAVHLRSLGNRIEELWHQVDESPQEVNRVAYEMFAEVDLINQQIDAEEQRVSDGD